MCLLCGMDMTKTWFHFTIVSSLPGKYLCLARPYYKLAVPLILRSKYGARPRWRLSELLKLIEYYMVCLTFDRGVEADTFTITNKKLPFNQAAL